MSGYIGVGQFVKLHGIHGELLISPFNPDTEVFATGVPLFIQEHGIYNRLSIKRIRAITKGILVCIQGIDSIDDALSFKKKQIFIDKNDIILGKNEYLVSAIFNLSCYNSKNKNIGTVSNIYQGDTDVIEIKAIDKTYLIPMIDTNIISIDCDNGKVVVQNEERYKI